MVILDLSKTLMYDFHCLQLHQAKLLFTDTDSLTHEIETEDVYKDFWKGKNRFDNSDYAENSPFYDKTNHEKVIKYESAGL